MVVEPGKEHKLPATPHGSKPHWTSLSAALGRLTHYCHLPHTPQTGRLPASAINVPGTPS